MTGAQHETYIQAAGRGRRMSAAAICEATGKSPSLHRAMLQYANAFLKQTTSTTLANGRSKIEERLARWLLMADDRIDSDELPLTHEFLSLMLGTQRPGVTIAVDALRDDGLITTRRGKHHHRRSQSLGKEIERDVRPSRRLGGAAAAISTIIDPVYLCQWHPRVRGKYRRILKTR